MALKLNVIDVMNNVNNQIAASTATPEIIGSNKSIAGYNAPTKQKIIEPNNKESSRHRNWCFTLNNWTIKEAQTLIEAGEMGKYPFICWGYEICPSTGTPHLQGYLEVKHARTLAGLKTDPGLQRARLEPRKASKAKAVTYCAKEWAKLMWKEWLADQCTPKELKENEDSKAKFDQERYDLEMRTWTEKTHLKWMHNHPDLWLFIKSKEIVKLSKRNNYFFMSGDIMYGWQPGKRTDINIVKDIVNKGGSIHDLIDHANSYQALQFGAKMLSVRPPRDREPPYVAWIMGPSGFGKSKLARDWATGSVWVNNNSLQWFDGYCGQETVIIDDFRDRQCNYEWLLRLTDRYPLSVPIKGGFVEWNPKVIFFTCMMHPVEAVLGDSHDQDNTQFIRRIKKVVSLDTKVEVPTEEKSQFEIEFETKIAAANGISLTNPGDYVAPKSPRQIAFENRLISQNAPVSPATPPKVTIPINIVPSVPTPGRVRT